MASSNTLKDEILALFPDNLVQEISALDMRNYVHGIFDNKEELIVKVETAQDIKLNKLKIFEKSLISIYNDGPNNGLWMSTANNPIRLTQFIKIADLGGVVYTNLLKSDGSVPMDSTYTPVNDQDIATKKFVLDNAGGSGPSVDDEYIRTKPTPIEVGGAEVGTTFSGTTADALDKILYPYVNPRFTSFSMSSQTSTLEVGDKITGGVRRFNWNIDVDDNVASNSISIYANGLLQGNLINDDTQDINIGSDIVKTSATTQNFKIEAENTESHNFNRSFNIYWRWRGYYGTGNSTITESDILSLENSRLYNNENNTYNCPANNFKWICYPTVFGLASKFTDIDTGFGVAMESPIITQVTNAYGIQTDYYCYRTTNSLVGSIRIKIG